MHCFFTKVILPGVNENFLKEIMAHLCFLLIYTPGHWSVTNFPFDFSLWVKLTYSGITILASLAVKSMEILPLRVCVLDLQLLFLGVLMDCKFQAQQDSSWCSLGMYSILTPQLLPETKEAQSSAESPWRRFWNIQVCF